jgi:hypothetical protein
VKIGVGSSFSLRGGKKDELTPVFEECHRRSGRAGLAPCFRGWVRCRGRRIAMIELTPGQLQALDAERSPVSARDPRNGQEYLLIKREVYERLQSLLRPLNRNWDNPADDHLIRKEADESR